MIIGKLMHRQINRWTYDDALFVSLRRTQPRRNGLKTDFVKTTQLPSRGSRI